MEKLSNKAVVQKSRAELSSQRVFQSCLKSHSRRAGRAELVTPRQWTKTDLMKLFRRAIRAEFVCLTVLSKLS